MPIICPKCHASIDQTLMMGIDFIKCPHCAHQFQLLSEGQAKPATFQLEFTIKGQPTRVPWDGRKVVVGTSPQADVTIIDPSKTVSGKHLVLSRSEGCIVVEDLGSTNGTFIDDRQNRLQPNSPCKVKPDSLILLGPYASLKITPVQPSKPSPFDTKTIDIKSLDLPLGESIVVGRAKDADLVVDSPQVSRHHARLTRTSAGIEVQDLGSTNGTFINGKRLMQGVVSQGDILGIGPARFEIKAERFLTQVQVKGGVRLDCRNLAYILPNGKAIVKPVNLSFLPGEFVGIMGTSGCGKTSLLNMLNGSIRYYEGCVWLNNMKLLPNYDWLRLQIGYVPQRDIVHSELDVYQILSYAARLRLGPDLTEEDMDELIRRVLRTLDLEDKIDSRFNELSGGQQKRINVAVELIPDPNIFFLDEPTSGLDPGLESETMALFKKYSKEQEKTVVMVTHVTENIRMMDKVVIMAPGGCFTFFGEPDEALEYFKADNFVDIYSRIKTFKGGYEEWYKRYYAWPSFKNYSYIHQEIGSCPTSEIAKSKKPALGSRIIGWLRQLVILTTRYAAIFSRDMRNLLIIGLQAPLIGLIIVIVYQELANTNLPKSMQESFTEGVMFLMVLSALWFGTSNAAREIAKERAIFKRERMIFLKLGPYILSKFLFLSLICFFQCILMMGIVFGLLPTIAENLPQIFLIIFLSSLAGISMGLAISSLVSTSNMAVSLVPLVLLPQIIFSGMVYPEERMNKNPYTMTISRCMVAYWGVHELREINVGLPKEIENDVEKLTDEEKVKIFNGISFGKLDNADAIDKAKNDVIINADEILKQKMERIKSNSKTDKNLEINALIIFGFIPVMLVIAAIALKSKEKEGFANR